jgi:hypothetical protein
MCANSPPSCRVGSALARPGLELPPTRPLGLPAARHSTLEITTDRAPPIPERREIRARSYRRRYRAARTRTSGRICAHLMHGMNTDAPAGPTSRSWSNSMFGTMTMPPFLMVKGDYFTGLTPLELAVDTSATRWLKGSFGFRADREVIINLVTQLFMRVQIPPSRCKSDSIAPRPATGSQRSEAGLNGGLWKPPSGYPV